MYKDLVKIIFKIPQVIASLNQFDNQIISLLSQFIKEKVKFWLLEMVIHADADHFAGD